MVDTNFFVDLKETLAEITQMIKGAFDTIDMFVECLPTEVGVALGALLALVVALTIVEVFT